MAQLPKNVGLFDDRVRKILTEIGDMLSQKNRAYGNSALQPARIFSKADTVEQLRVRIDDKLTRILNGDASEDSRKDLIGYLILERIAMEDRQPVAEEDYEWERMVAEDGVDPHTVKRHALVNAYNV